MTVSVVGLSEIMISQDIDLLDDRKTDWIVDRSETEMEFEPDMKQMHEQELTKLRELEWIHDLPADPKRRCRRFRILISPASNKSVTIKLIRTGLLQMAPCAFPNPASICSILCHRRRRRGIFLSGEWGWDSRIPKAF